MAFLQKHSFVFPTLRDFLSLPTVRDLVDPHRRHPEEFRDIVHDANACPSFVLPLGEIKEGNDGGFLVLGWVSSDDLLGTLEVLGVELERNLEAW